MNPTQFVTSGAVEIAVYVRGRRAKNAPTVVLVHGYPDNAGVWSKVATQLSARYRVVTYDVRGAGQSTRPAGTSAYRLEHLVADLEAVIDAVSPQRAVNLVGHDWGSIQSWEAVTEPRLATRIASFTTISGPALDHVAHRLRARLRERPLRGTVEVAQQALHSWYMAAMQLPGVAPAVWRAGLDRRWPRMLERLEKLRGTEPSETQREDGIFGIELYRANLGDRLGRPQVRRTELPVQLIVPTRDPFVTPLLLEGLTQWAPRLWRREVAAGHWLPLTQPQRLARWIGEFVDHVEGAEEGLALQRARRLALGRPGARHAGKLVVVTGAGSGIGRETALLFARHGADLVLVDLDEQAAQRTADAIEALGAAAWVRRADVGSAEQMEALARWVEAEFEAPDIVVNNAGIGMSGPMLKMSTADWEKILRVNLWGVIHGARLFGQQMVASSRRGHIVNVSSGLAFFPTRLTPAYNTTKAAVQMLSECLRAELGNKGIGVSTVYPGVVNTPIVGATQFVGRDSAEQQRDRQRAERFYRLRNLKPRAVAEAILDAVTHDRPEVRVGAEVHAIRYLTRFAPSLARRLAALDLMH